MTEQVSKNKQAERICGRRPHGNAVFEPHELGYACPICGASDETTLFWSEYNYFIYCKNCNLDIPSCLCKKYPEPRLTDKPLSKRERVIENTRVFLECLEDRLKKNRGKMKVYIASSFKLIEKVIYIANILREHGFEITQYWWERDYKKMEIYGEAWYNHPDVKRISKKNFDAIDEADVVLLVCPDTIPICFNGANIEVGYAIAKGKPVYSIGKLQRSAMYVSVKRLNNIDEFLKEVERNEGRTH